MRVNFKVDDNREKIERTVSFYDGEFYEFERKWQFKFFFGNKKVEKRENNDEEKG